MTNKKFKKNPTNFTRMADLISGHPVQKSIAFHFHPCNPVHLPQKKVLCCSVGSFNQMYLYIWWRLAILCGN